MQFGFEVGRLGTPTLSVDPGCDGGGPEWEFVDGSSDEVLPPIVSRSCRLRSANAEINSSKIPFPMAI